MILVTTRRMHLTSESALHQFPRLSVSSPAQRGCRDSNGRFAARAAPDLFHCPLFPAALGRPAGRRRCGECWRQAPFNEDKCQLLVFYGARSPARPPTAVQDLASLSANGSGERTTSSAKYTSFVACSFAVFHPI